MYFHNLYRAHIAAIAAVLLSVVVYSQAHARERFQGQYANVPHHEWYKAQRNKAGNACCDEADGHDYYGDYRINEDGSVEILGRHPDHIQAYKVLDGPNPTGHAVWWYVDYGDWGVTTYCFAPGAGG